jgi:hypothetical protein
MIAELLLAASRKDHDDIVRRLLDYGADAITQ